MVITAIIGLIIYFLSIYFSKTFDYKEKRFGNKEEYYNILIKKNIFGKIKLAKSI